ncbi:serine protease AprX [Lentzea fradiae]|uniref:Serine protease AprX n=1 Tax=Lentzea fradiae TaxID=200378 RepID=A0A1G8BSE5_9PSEU|nr:hypothetical protein [Lentzea fradiae]SDH36061.1 serine protease AprX [Lentzea fradiae]
MLPVAVASPVATAAPASTVYVHGTGITAAQQAVEAAGLRKITSFRKIGVVAARGDASRISSARTKAGVTRVEVRQPVRFLGSTSHTATRGLDARNDLGLTGEGVSVAVIDSGADPTRPSRSSTTPAARPAAAPSTPSP